jgi:hypothetical protein
VSEPSPWFFLGIYVVINTAVACTSLGKVTSPVIFNPCSWPTYLAS